MARVRIRRGQEDDLPALRAIDRIIITSHVWRINWASPPAMGATFERFPLPRAVKMPYPRPVPTALPSEEGLFLVADHEGALLGYLHGDGARVLQTLWITDLVVTTPWRNKGIGSGLVQAAIAWAESEGLRRVVLEMSFRNAPAVEFARRLGFNFSGFQYNYYPNGDAALFMALEVAG